MFYVFLFDYIDMNILVLLMENVNMKYVIGVYGKIILIQIEMPLAS